ncbi:MAG: PilN domain-containing protein [Candidatus Electrothrix sp. Rat3]|nr:PilN domain-containing protein [Candidatus Electrothrix rattekaaiensis]
MKQKARAVRQLAVSGAAIIATLTILLLGTGFLSVKVSGLEKSIDDLTARKKELQKTLDLIVKLEKQKQLVEQQIGIVHELEKKSQLTVRILDEIARITPHERMWLTTFAQNASSLQLSGMALDNRTIADYLEELKTSDYLTDVTLKRSALSKYGGRNLKRFSLSCSVTLPGTDDEASKETGEKK